MDDIVGLESIANCGLQKYQLIVFYYKQCRPSYNKNVTYNTGAT
jgi:hypothetical protein